MTFNSVRTIRVARGTERSLLLKARDIPIRGRGGILPVVFIGVDRLVDRVVVRKVLKEDFSRGVVVERHRGRVTHVVLVDAYM